jgi:uncharacterized protein DUF7009
MKLRIQNNSLRLRLTKTEVARLGDQGFVESAIQFPGDRVLRYSVAAAPETERISVCYQGDSVCVLLPIQVAQGWAKDNQVSLEGTDSGVQILVEKDFQCLHRAAGSEPDSYPNPME